MTTTSLAHGTRLDPVTLQNELERLRTLTMTAFQHNQALRQRLQMQNLVLSNAMDGLESYYNQKGAALPTGVDPAALVTYEDLSGAVIDYHEGVPSMGSTLGTLHLGITQEFNKIPLVTNAYGERKPATGITITVDGEETTDESMAWALLSPDLFWATVSPKSSLQVVIDLPPGLDPAINHIGVETVLPELTPYTVEYMNYKGTYIPLTHQQESQHTITRHFYFPAALFGNRIRLTLQGHALGDGQYLYALGHVYASLQRYYTSGRIVTPLSFQLNGQRGFITKISPNPTTPNAAQQTDVIRYRIGTGLNAQNQITGLLYDSETGEYPVSQREIGPFTGDRLYLETTYQQYQETTPTSGGLVVNYTRRTIV